MKTKLSLLIIESLENDLRLYNEFMFKHVKPNDHVSNRIREIESHIQKIKDGNKAGS